MVWKYLSVTSGDVILLNFLHTFSRFTVLRTELTGL
jgi:hypothetical protein